MTIIDPTDTFPTGTVGLDRYGRAWTFYGEPEHPEPVWHRDDSDPPESLTGQLLNDVHGPITVDA